MCDMYLHKLQVQSNRMNLSAFIYYFLAPTQLQAPLFTHSDNWTHTSKQESK